MKDAFFYGIINVLGILSSVANNYSDAIVLKVIGKNLRSKKFYSTKGKIMKKELLKALLIVAAILLAVFAFYALFGSNAKNDHVVEDGEGVIIYESVNFRETPNIDTDKNIIGKLKLGDIVEVLGRDGEFVKIVADGKIGYVINESISDKYVMFDVSDYNWGSEYSSKESFIKFTENARKSCKFAGYYVQVQRGTGENEHWKTLVEALDEMEIPYGLYIYSRGTTASVAESEYEAFKTFIEDVPLKYNKYPLMIDLEYGGDQTGILDFYNEELGKSKYIVYSNASRMCEYGYHEMVDEYWVAHYEVANVIPYKYYAEYDDASQELADAKIWQYSDDGFKRLFGTDHLDLNIVTDGWYEKYAR